MTDKPVTYTEADAGVALAAGELTQVMESYRTAVARIEAANARMVTLSQAAPTGYMDHLLYINEQAAAFPEDQAWQDLKRRADKLTGDFNVVSSYIQSRIAKLQEA